MKKENENVLVIENENIDKVKKMLQNENIHTYTPYWGMGDYKVGEVGYLENAALTNPHNEDCIMWSYYGVCIGYNDTVIEKDGIFKFKYNPTEPEFYLRPKESLWTVCNFLFVYISSYEELKNWMTEGLYLSLLKLGKIEDINSLKEKFPEVYRNCNDDENNDDNQFPEGSNMEDAPF